MRARSLFALGALALSLSSADAIAASPAEASPLTYVAGTRAEAAFRDGPIRGYTIGPIENALHPGRGYGTPKSAETIDALAKSGANWISLTPFGRVFDLAPSGIDLNFEASFRENRAAVLATIRQAHAAGLRVMLVPHLWVESGAWRGEIDPGSDAGWDRWQRAYTKFVCAWAAVAREGGADLLSVGVELRSWVTTRHAALFLPVIAAVRRVYSGPITYASNWDDVDNNAILGALDVIGINAFFPLASKENAPYQELAAEAQNVASKVHMLAARWRKPVVFTETGYTTRPNPALRPWEWPEALSPVVDERMQAEAYRALLSGMLSEPAFFGFFVWRVYADLDDVSQEPEWGFSPWGKQAGVVVEQAFRAHWAADDVLSPMRHRAW